MWFINMALYDFDILFVNYNLYIGKIIYKKNIKRFHSLWNFYVYEKRNSNSKISNYMRRQTFNLKTIWFQVWFHVTCSKGPPTLCSTIPHDTSHTNFFFLPQGWIEKKIFIGSIFYFLWWEWIFFLKDQKKENSQSLFFLGAYKVKWYITYYYFSFTIRKPAITIFFGCAQGKTLLLCNSSQTT